MAKSKPKTKSKEKTKTPATETKVEEQQAEAPETASASDTSVVAERETTTAPAPDATDRTAELEAQVADLNDRLLRKIAEFDNYRKRTAREQLSLLESAAGHLIEKLLPVLDDMEQLEKLNSEQATVAALHEGLILIHKKLLDTLRKEGVEIIPAEGEPFDPQLHEVLAVMEDAEREPGVILVEQQKGYRLKNRILRHSRVVINKDE